MKIVTSAIRSSDRLWAWGMTGGGFFLGLFFAESRRLKNKTRLREDARRALGEK